MSARGEERSNRIDSVAQMFKGVSDSRDGNISGDADDLDLKLPLLRQCIGVEGDSTIGQQFQGKPETVCGCCFDADGVTTLTNWSQGIRRSSTVNTLTSVCQGDVYKRQKLSFIKVASLAVLADTGLLYDTKRKTTEFYFNSK